ELFMPMDQFANSTMSVLVHSEASAGTVVSAIRSTVKRVDPFVAVFDARTLENLVDAETRGSRFVTQLFLGLGLAGLFLALVGVYSVVGYFVAQRRHEIGVRLAIGASRREVVSLVLRQGGFLAVCGVVIGSVLARAGSRLLAEWLLGAAPRACVSFVVVAGVLTATSILACAVRAVRAARVDPASSLKA